MVEPIWQHVCKGGEPRHKKIAVLDNLDITQQYLFERRKTPMVLIKIRDSRLSSQITSPQEGPVHRAPRNHDEMRRPGQSNSREERSRYEKFFGFDRANAEQRSRMFQNFKPRTLEPRFTEKYERLSAERVAIENQNPIALRAAEANLRKEVFNSKLFVILIITYLIFCYLY
jgi:hypothetical protein